MGKEIFSFGDTEIEKNKFYHHKSPIFKDLDIEKMLVSKKISFGEKNIGYLHNYYKVKPLHVNLP